MREEVVDEGSVGGLEWAVCASAYPGERRSGDAYLVLGTESGVLVAVVDGLGHGSGAPDVAELALDSLRRTAGRSPSACLTACHIALRGSRGAALTLARNWFSEGRPQWSGRPLGSYEEWSRLVGGILEAADIPGFLGNKSEARDRSTATNA